MAEDMKGMAPIDDDSLDEVVGGVGSVNGKATGKSNVMWSGSVNSKSNTAGRSNANGFTGKVGGKAATFKAGSVTTKGSCVAGKSNKLTKKTSAPVKKITLSTKKTAGKTLGSSGNC